MTDPAGAPAPALPFLVRGDVDGFFGLALDNLVQLLLVDALCRARDETRRCVGTPL